MTLHVGCTQLHEVHSNKVPRNDPRPKSLLTMNQRTTIGKKGRRSHGWFVPPWNVKVQRRRQREHCLIFPRKQQNMTPKLPSSQNIHWHIECLSKRELLFRCMKFIYPFYNSHFLILVIHCSILFLTQWIQHTIFRLFVDIDMSILLTFL